ncbi:MAG: gamma-glutamylcyclotransferase [Hydrogenophilaceae bacterium]|nr:gamma-glutamylcyclotransferase [Hydrogenophilaceae bacterium]
MRFPKIIAAVLLLFGLLAPGAQAGEDCHPLPTPGHPQYLVGYGSLMDEASRLRTAPNAKEALPVRVQGFRRAWITPGSEIGFSTTFLGVSPNAKAGMNAVLFALADDAELGNMDAREAGYCRVAVAPEQLTPLAGERPQGEVWLYVNAMGKTAAPSRRYPIVQSYVDIFLAGCLQIERQYQLAGFAEECVDSTHGWSKHWVNDRLYPRRPFIYQPNAGTIDRLLERKRPAEFRAIRIE